MRKREPMDETVRSPSSPQQNNGLQGSGPNLSNIPLRVWAFALIVATLLFGLFGFWGLYLFRGRFGAQGPTPTAIIWTPTASATPIDTPTPLPTRTPEGEVLGGATPTPSADIATGGYVRVTGTGGYGLSLREGPGANYTRADIASDGEVFVVVEGPRTASGSPWWRIRDPDNEERYWWAIANYLQPFEHP